MSAVTATAWSAAAHPSPTTAPTRTGPCSCCGTHTQLWPATQAVSRNFCGYDTWTHPSQGWLCACCCWSYTTPALRKDIHLVTRHPATLTVLDSTAAGELLLSALEADQALVVPLRPGRRHLLPTATFGHVTTDTTTFAWRDHDAHLLERYLQLRHLGFSPAALTGRAPDYRQLMGCPPQRRDWVLQVWGELGAWRVPDSPWLALAARLGRESR